MRLFSGLGVQMWWLQQPIVESSEKGGRNAEEEVKLLYNLAVGSVFQMWWNNITAYGCPGLAATWVFLEWRLLIPCQEKEPLTWIGELLKKPASLFLNLDQSSRTVSGWAEKNSLVWETQQNGNPPVGFLLQICFLRARGSFISFIFCNGSFTVIFDSRISSSCSRSSQTPGIFAVISVTATPLMQAALCDVPENTVHLWQVSGYLCCPGHAEQDKAVGDASVCCACL